VLWLRRKRGESIVVEDGRVEIVIGRVDGDMVRVGVQAPDHVGIMRGEIWLARERDSSSVAFASREGEGLK
jgi:carbon storage regulator